MLVGWWCFFSIVVYIKLVCFYSVCHFCSVHPGSSFLPQAKEYETLKTEYRNSRHGQMGSSQEAKQKSKYQSLEAKRCGNEGKERSLKSKCFQMC